MRIELPERHPAQEQIVREARRFNVLDCGRRFGKDILGIDLIVDTVLGPYPAGWFAPTYKNLTEDWRAVAGALEPLVERRNEQDHRLDLITGGTVEMWSLDNPDAARGRAYKRIIVNEAAMIRALQAAWQKVLRPTLADYLGDGWFLSTPRGFDFFRTMYEWGQDPDGHPEWKSWKFPTLANPFIRPSEVEAARKELPERVFAQEFLAEFLPDGGGVFRRVTEAATATAQEQAIPGHQYVTGVDWGRTNDYTVLSVVDATTKELVALDRFSQIDFRLQRDRLTALWQRFGGVIIPETNNFGLPVVEELQRAGLPVQPFTTTNATKLALVDGLAMAFEQGTLKILPDPTLISELQAYEQERLPSGLVRFSAPEGMHDDCVISLALAWYGASQAGPIFAWGGDDYDDD